MPEAFVIKRRVQFAETDMAGVMHFAVYYHLIEEVEHAFWRSAGFSVMTRDSGREIGWPRVSTSCEYHSPAHFEDELELALRVASVSNRSVTYEVEFSRDRKRIATGRTTAVCCSMVAGAFEPIDIPAPLRAALENRKCPS